jgi:hypothetical protein
LVGQCFSFCFCVSTSCLSPVLVFVRHLVFSPCPCVPPPPPFPCGLCLAFIKPENAMRSCLGNGMHRGAAGRRPFFFFSAW